MLRTEIDRVMPDLPVLDTFAIQVRVRRLVDVLRVVGIGGVREVRIGGYQLRAFVGLGITEGGDG